jgi:hypothetical protein
VLPFGIKLCIYGNRGWVPLCMEENVCVLLWKVIISCLVCSVLQVWNRIEILKSQQLPCLCSVLQIS